MDLVCISIGEFCHESTAAIEVNDHSQGGRGRRKGKVVDGERGNGAFNVGHRHEFVVIDCASLESDTLRRKVDVARAAVTRADQGELPACVSLRRRPCRRLGIRAARRFAVEKTTPGKKLGVLETVVALLNLQSDRASGGIAGDSIRGCGRY